MKKKLFTFSDLEIWQEDDRYFVIYDVGAHQVVMRKDEITEEEAKFACADSESAMKVLFDLQKRLIEQGVDPYVSNVE